ncbi:outer membrane protein [Maribacter sp. X9]|uniref:outer membrane protein n=1 Tax=Maribacter sp. X9 TaxID=3402159 RepID=UPI003AF340BE
MKRLLLISALTLSTYFLHSQDQKWSLEANYPLNLVDGSASGINNLNGILDLGLKYRFIELGPVNLGMGLNTSFLKKNNNFTFGTPDSNDLGYDYKAKTYLLQPKLFMEMPIPGLTKLKPQLGIGYSVVFDDTYFKDGETVVFDNSETDGALNLNLGLSYDISSRIFIQIQYDYLNIARKGESVFNEQSYTYDFKENANILKAGVGFRF